MKTPGSILTWMVLAILGIAALAVFDHRREAAAALDDFAQQQVLVAQGIAATLGTNGQSDIPTLAGRGDLVVLSADLPATVFHMSSGREVRIAALTDALANGHATAELGHDDAASIGLPPRMAHAGFAYANQADGHARVVAVVASAIRERDREIRAEWRLVVAFLLTSACVVAFGVYALRVQREHLALSRELAIAEAVRSRDERLVRADKLATLGAMATGIAHEVSTPLGVIVGRAEQLASRVHHDERATRAVDAIAEQAARIGAIVRSFLAFARGGAVSLEHLPASTAARAATDLVRHRFDAAHVELESQLGASDVEIACDATLFPQVLVNLLLNACDACAEGGHVLLSVSVTAIEEVENVQFAIVDDGAGIAPADAARATEPFFTTKPEGRGTGIGLSIANEIVHHHGGHLRVAPREDGHQGTAATVTMAAVRAT